MTQKKKKKKNHYWHDPHSPRNLSLSLPTHWTTHARLHNFVPPFLRLNFCLGGLINSYQTNLWNFPRPISSQTTAIHFLSSHLSIFSIKQLPYRTETKISISSFFVNFLIFHADHYLSNESHIFSQSQKKREKESSFFSIFYSPTSVSSLSTKDTGSAIIKPF